MDTIEATAWLSRHVPIDADPVLSTDDLGAILDEARLPDAYGNLPCNVTTSSTWAASTVVQMGAVVTAAPSAGRWWICVAPGTTGAVQPDWGDLSSDRPGTHSVTDGTVVWLDAGSGWAGQWDLHLAAALAWEAKAARAAGRFDFTTDGQTFRRAQVIDQCQAMARMHRRRRASSAPLL